MEYLTLGKPNVLDLSYLNPWKKYGVFFTCVLYGLRIVTLLPLPQATFNFAGMIFYNTFPGTIHNGSTFEINNPKIIPP